MRRVTPILLVLLLGVAAGLAVLRASFDPERFFRRELRASLLRSVVNPSSPDRLGAIRTRIRAHHRGGGPLFVDTADAASLATAVQDLTDSGFNDPEVLLGDFGRVPWDLFRYWTDEAERSHHGGLELWTPIKESELDRLLLYVNRDRIALLSGAPRQSLLSEGQAATATWSEERVKLFRLVWERHKLALSSGLRQVLEGVRHKTALSRMRLWAEGAGSLPDGIELEVDPWGHVYRVERAADGQRVIRSAGPDFAYGTADDIVVPIPFVH